MGHENSKRHRGSLPLPWSVFTERAARFGVEPLREPSPFSLTSTVECRCSCGALYTGKAALLANGKKRSCGCVRRTMAAGLRKSKLTYAEAAVKIGRFGAAFAADHDPGATIVGVTAVGRYRFRCRCGTEFGASCTLKAVLSGNSVSCGCAKIAAIKKSGVEKMGRYSASQKAASRRRYSIESTEVATVLSRAGAVATNLPEGRIYTRFVVEAVCNCGEIFSARATDVTRALVRSCGCARSFIEQEMAVFLSSLAPDAVRNTRSVIGPMEIDVWVPSARLGVELDGLHWHSEKVKGPAARTAMATKLAAMKAAGNRCVFIFEDEWKDRQPVVERYLRALLAPRHRVGARTCAVAEDAEAAVQFEDANHLQGAGGGAQRRFVLRHAGETVAAASFRHISGTEKASGPDSWELTRYTVGDTAVHGGLLRLVGALRHAVTVGEIVTYSDHRYSAGGVYTASGFEPMGEVPPRYWYVRGQSRYHRFKYRKSELERLGWLRDGETEEACMVRRGFSRIWDAGKTKWVLRSPESSKPSVP